MTNSSFLQNLEKTEGSCDSLVSVTCQEQSKLLIFFVSFIIILQNFSLWKQ